MLCAEEGRRRGGTEGPVLRVSAASGDATRTFNVLFLCTGNSARSILAEAILNRQGNGRFVGHSAGSLPTGRVNPFAIDFLRAQGLRVENLRSKSWDEFAAPGAPVMHFVITVCDDAAGEACPVWPGRPVTAHWGVPDPAAIEGSDEAKRAAFRQVFQTLRHRIALFTSLPVSRLEGQALSREVQAIGLVSH
jgi:arsenate reductase